MLLDWATDKDLVMFVLYTLRKNAVNIIQVMPALKLNNYNKNKKFNPGAR
jgi:hypothetical protein